MKITFAIPMFSTDSKSAEGKAVCKVIDWCASRVGSRKYKPGAVVFTIDRAFKPHGSDKANAAALETLLTCLTALDCIWLKYHPGHVPLYETGVYYARTLVWDTIPALYRRGFGDCKSLTACRIAELRMQHIWATPTFRHQADPRSTMFHILVMFANGTWEDPSKALGMLSYEESPGSMSRHMHRVSTGFGLEKEEVKWLLP